MQAINLPVFALHLQFIREDLSKRTLSVRTSLMLNAVLSRFTDFCVSYALSMIPTFMRMCLTGGRVFCVAWHPVLKHPPTFAGIARVRALRSKHGAVLCYKTAAAPGGSSVFRKRDPLFVWALCDLWSVGVGALFL